MHRKFRALPNLAVVKEEEKPLRGLFTERRDRKKKKRECCSSGPGKEGPAVSRRQENESDIFSNQEANGLASVISVAYHWHKLLLKLNHRKRELQLS